MTELTPYEQMRAEREQTSIAGKPIRLNDYQRAQRKRANTLAQRRAVDVLKHRHAEEFRDLAKAERHALYAVIDAENARGGDRDLFDIVKD